MDAVQISHLVQVWVHLCQMNEGVEFNWYTYLSFSDGHMLITGNCNN
jgi:hypothetical protein